MNSYSPWTWSPEYNRHYCYSLDGNGQARDVHWSEPVKQPAPVEAAPSVSYTPRIDSKPNRKESYNLIDSYGNVQQSVSSPYQSYQPGHTPRIDSKSNRKESNSFVDSYGNVQQSVSSPYQSYQTGQYSAPSTQYTTTSAKYNFSEEVPYDAYQTVQTAQSSYEPLYTGTQEYAPYAAGLPAAHNTHQPHTWVQPTQQQNAWNANSRLQYTSISQQADYPSSEGYYDRLDPRFVRVEKPRAYFKKGRVFMTLVTNVQSSNNDDEYFTTIKYGENVFAKIARFVVIRPKGGHCLCLPIHTYSERGTSKPGLNPDNHAALIPEGTQEQLHPQERPLRLPPLQMKVEGKDVDISPMSRINFGKVSTVDYGVKVRTVGRIIPACLQQLEDYFLGSLGVNKASEQYWRDEDEAHGH